MKGLLQEFGFGGAIGVDINALAQFRPSAFRAEFEEVHLRYSTGERMRAVGKMIQDSRGRIRRDFITTREPNPREEETVCAAIVIDLVAQVHWFFDATSGTWTKVDLAAIRNQSPRLCQANYRESESCSIAAPTAPAMYRKLLGTKSIEGIDCQGILSRNDDGEWTIEEWFSPALFAHVLSVEKNSEGEISYRLLNIHLTEPDPILFVPSAKP